MRSLKLIFRTSKLIVKLEQLRGRVMSLKGWSRRCFAILLGIVTALALPPLYAWPLLVPGFVGFIWLIEGSLKPKKFPYAPFVTGSEDGNFAVEFSGYNPRTTGVYNSFKLSHERKSSDSFYWS